MKAGAFGPQPAWRRRLKKNQPLDRPSTTKNGSRVSGSVGFHPGPRRDVLILFAASFTTEAFLLQFHSHFVLYQHVLCQRQSPQHYATKQILQNYKYFYMMATDQILQN
jgi:hypothetical protein